MLKSHMDANEATLLATSLIPANSGHSLHKGTPREAFISHFLINHLSEKVAIGTGEVIDANSQPRQPRNQHDIVVYRREFPKLDFGGGVNGFLAESVVATIEVKSCLTNTEFHTAMQSARNVKALVRQRGAGIVFGYQPPSILSYLIAYNGPASMSTVHGWVAPFMATAGLSNPQLGMTLADRIKVAAPCLDGVFVLGKGYMNYENCPVSIVSDTYRATNPSIRWQFADSPNGNLLMLFTILTNAISGLTASSFNPILYAQNASWKVSAKP